MQIKDTRLTALVAAAGLWICVAASAQAACDTASCGKSGAKTAVTTADSPIVLSKFNKRKAQAATKIKSAHAGSGPKTTDKTTADALAKPKTSNDAQPNLANLPPSIANARAELTTGNPLSAAEDEARNIAATDDNEIVTMNGVQIASADQLNDIDRAVGDEVKSDEAPAVSPPPVPSGRILKAAPSGERHVFANDGGEPWNKTSLLGKIFVAFGSLLTLASAARLIIA